jgi:DNA-binding response OmpR family regulator
MGAAVPRANILIADVPEMEDVLRSCFSSHHVRYVIAFDEAVTALRKTRYDMVVVGLTFDESHMFKLVHFVRSLEGYRAVPVVCVRGMPSVLSDHMRRGLRDAVHAIGGDDFIDFGLLPNELSELCRKLEGALAGAPAEQALNRAG